MLYVLLLSWHEGLSREERDGALAKRAQWEYPAGARNVGEYWPATSSPAVISIVEAETFAPLQEIQLTWGHLFDIHVYPATTPQEGLRTGQEIMQRLGASSGSGLP